MPLGLTYATRKDSQRCTTDRKILHIDVAHPRGQPRRHRRRPLAMICRLVASAAPHPI